MQRINIRRIDQILMHILRAQSFPLSFIKYIYFSGSEKYELAHFKKVI